MKPLQPLVISGREVLPLVEGGKGISVSNGESSGAWAAAGGVATFSGVNADFYDDTGKLIPVVYHGKTRRERHEELIAYGIRGGIAQARIAIETSRDVAPDWPRGLVSHALPEVWREFCARTGCATIHISHESLTEDQVKAIKDAGYAMLSYTVNERELAEKLWGWGVDSVFSDKPELLL